MIDELVTFKTAKLAKEKGFDIITDKYWCNYYMAEPLNKWKLLPKQELSVSFMEWAAPTQSLLQRWLREVHDINIVIFSDGFIWMFDLRYPDPDSLSSYPSIMSREEHRTTYDTYEESLENGLQEALKLIKL